MPRTNGNTVNGNLATSYKLAYGISLLFNPLLIAVPLYMIVALHTAPNLYEGLLWWLIVSVAVSLIPALFVRRGVIKGQFTDHDISQREQRLVPFLITIISMSVTLALLILMQVSGELLATFIGMITATVLALLITQLARWKISLHLIGITGAITTLVLFVSPLLYFLSPLILIVGWARWRVKAHTIMQSAAGACLAIVVTVAVFQLIGV